MDDEDIIYVGNYVLFSILYTGDRVSGSGRANYSTTASCGKRPFGRSRDQGDLESRIITPINHMPYSNPSYPQY